MQPKGGTEILKEQLLSKLQKNDLDDVNLMITHCSAANIIKDKINVLWQHLGPKQPATMLMSNRRYVDNVDFFVYVSNWQYNQFRNYYNIPEYKSFVIKNATESVDFFHKTKNEKVQLIYHTVPWRGLEILLNVIDILNKERNDFELNVYSSVKIYGSEFEKETNGQFEPLFERCKNTANVKYYGYVDNFEIKQVLKKMDILTYPCIEEETSCLSIIEAMMAGCHVLTTNCGALPETCGEFATMVEIDSSADSLIEKYYHKLKETIDKFKAGNYIDIRNMQMQYFHNFYSWEKRVHQWTNFLDYIKR